MARLNEVNYVLRTVGWWPFLRRVINEINEDGVLNMAAAVAFYWLLALFPFIIFLMSLAPMMPRDVRADTQTKIEVWAQTNLGPTAAAPVLDNIKDVLNQPRGGLFSVSLLFTLWAASNGMNATMAALDRCYDVTRPRPFFVQRGVAIAITVCMVLVVLVVITLLPVTSLVLRLFDTRFVEYAPRWVTGPTRGLIDVGRYFVGVALVILLVSSIYQFGVSVRRRWTLITPGAIVAVFGVMALAYGFNWYIQRFGAASYAKTYAGLGGVVILLLIFYLYAVVFLIGAEINSEIDYAMLGSGTDAATDPLPNLHRAHVHKGDDLARFRKQLEARRARRDR